MQWKHILTKPQKGCLDYEEHLKKFVYYLIKKLIAQLTHSPENDQAYLTM